MHLERTSPQRERVVEVASIIFTSSFLSALCVRVILGRRSLEIDINVEKKTKTNHEQRSYDKVNENNQYVIQLHRKTNLTQFFFFFGQERVVGYEPTVLCIQSDKGRGQ